MKSLQDYINTYRGIANKLNLRGESTELLVQMLANASYISEVENIAYSQEASFERATLINSKIQHCIDNMYSVFRGSCPRIVIKINALKYLSLKRFDEIMSSNSFKVYYLGYFRADRVVNPETEKIEYKDSGEFVYSDISINPGETVTIICLLSKEIYETSRTISSSNTGYFDCLENDLSDDFYLSYNTDSDKNNFSIKPTTNMFYDHIVNHELFDLTLPSFGSRIYYKNTYIEDKNTGKYADWPSSTTFKLKYFKFTELSEYSESELKRLTLKGTNYVGFNEEWLEQNHLSEFIPGMCLMKESERESLSTIHYSASLSRYTNSIYRSNFDLGRLLEETYPSKINTNGTKVIVENNNLNIYYIPKGQDILNIEDINSFKLDKGAYYVSNNLNIKEAIEYKINFNISVELYQDNLENKIVETDISGILEEYSKKFGVNFLTDSQAITNSLKTTSVLSEIESRIIKLDYIKKLKWLVPEYSIGNEIFNVDSNYWSIMIDDLILGSTYYTISATIATTTK